MESHLKISILAGSYTVCCLLPDAPLPAGLADLPFWSAMRTTDELSLVVPAAFVQPHWQVQAGFAVMKVHGPLDFALTGILASLSTALADAGISIFALSTFQTDYLLLPVERISEAQQALEKIGCVFS